MGEGTSIPRKALQGAALFHCYTTSLSAATSCVCFGGSGVFDIDIDGHSEECHFDREEVKGYTSPHTSHRE